MFEELELYLRSITSPENVVVVMNSCSNLEKAGILSHEVDIEQILRTVDHHDTENNLLVIFTVMSEYVEKTINEFGIYVNYGIPLSALNSILESILLISEYGDPEDIFTVLQTENSPVEKICDIFAIVHSLEWHDFAPYVEKINDALLERIEQVCEQNLPVEMIPDIEKYRNRVKRFRERFQGSFAYKVLSDGFSLKTPLKTLVGRYNEELGDLENDIQELPKAIMGLLLVSDVPNEELTKHAFLLLEDLAKDINVVTKAKQYLTSLLEEFS